MKPLKLRWYLSPSLVTALLISGGFVMNSELVAAQQTVTSATLSGRVSDPAGAAVSGAKLTATSLETNQTRVATTDYNGRYRFPLLQVGSYKLLVEAAGFSPLSRKLTLTVGQALDVPFRLELAALSAQVTVSSQIPTIETVRTQVTETVRPSEIDQLPSNGRNYLDLALLLPGVSPTNTGSNQRFAETSAVPGQGISVLGQRNLYNSFIVDGVSANDDAADLTGTYFSEEVIREFQVITTGGIAEFGRASGGVVNIITKSGTNNWHGNFYGFARNQRFDARNPLAPRKDLLTQAQYGGTLGGPIRQNRTFFFTNFEQTRRNYSTVITIAPPNVTAINNALDNFRYPGPRIETGVVPASFDGTNFFARLDHKLNSRNQLNGRYSLYHIDAVNSRSVGGLNSVSRGSGLSDTDQTVEVSNVATLSTRTLNETRFQITRSRLGAPINDSVGPAVNISGIASFGTATFSPVARDITLLEVVNNVSSQRGAHSLKAGGDFLYNRVNILFPGALQGVYNFTSPGNFLTGSYLSFQQAFGTPDQFQSNPNVGLFAQDEWRLRSNVTINAGLRYDLQFLPSPINTDTNNLAPRLGIAFSPNQKTVIRASVGLYYDRIPLRATSNALQRDGSKYVVVQLSPSQAGAPVFPAVLSARPAIFVTRPNITRMDPDIQTSYSEQVGIQFERELPHNTSISVGYLHLRGLHLIVSRNINVPRFPASMGVPNLGRPDPNWGNISWFEGSGDSYYDGMVVSLVKRTSSWNSLRVSYTLSKTIDDAGNFFFSTPQNNFNLHDDRGLSDNDQRHRLVISGTLQPPQTDRATAMQRVIRGFQLSYIFTYASRLPFNILLGSDRNFDTNNNDRPVGVGRNTGRGFDFSSLDVSLRRHFRLTERVGFDVVAEGFNLLNRSNYAVPNNTFGPGVIPLPSFGRPTAAFDSREFQFGLKLTF